MDREMEEKRETKKKRKKGDLPISFQIKAATLEEAVKGYGEAAKAGVQETIAKLEEMRREAASKIVTPGDAGFAAAASKIQMP